jgi:endonuclease/exonuclease/phosphatase family metal-dependent hydrolase
MEISPHSPTRRVRHAVLAGVAILGLGIWGASWRIPTGAAAGREIAFAEQIPARRADTFRVATWNIHSAKGRDGVVDLARIARRLDACDFIGLNEVRAAPGWSGPDQAEQLGRSLHAGWLFMPYEKRWGRDEFGNGIVSALPVSDWIRLPFPYTSAKGHGNLSVFTVDWNGTSVRVIVTHIDRQADRLPQLRAALERFNSLAGPTILMGDLNTTAADPDLAELLASPGVVDVLASKTARPTGDRIDWILIRGLECVNSGTEDHGESDHPLVWADLRLPKPPANRADPFSEQPERVGATVRAPKN